MPKTIFAFQKSLSKYRIHTFECPWIALVWIQNVVYYKLIFDIDLIFCTIRSHCHRLIHHFWSSFKLGWFEFSKRTTFTFLENISSPNHKRKNANSQRIHFLYFNGTTFNETNLKKEIKLKAVFQDTAK